MHTILHFIRKRCKWSIAMPHNPIYSLAVWNKSCVWTKSTYTVWNIYVSLCSSFWFERSHPFYIIRILRNLKRSPNIRTTRVIFNTYSHFMILTIAVWFSIRIDQIWNSLWNNVFNWIKKKEGFESIFLSERFFDVCPCI